MKKALLALGVAALLAAPAHADITHKISSSVSYSESYTGGDNTPSVLSTTVTGGVVPALPIYGSTTTTSGGVAGTLAGTIATDGAIALTSGGAGTQAVGQVILELTVK